MKKIILSLAIISSLNAADAGSIIEFSQDFGVLNLPLNSVDGSPAHVYQILEQRWLKQQAALKLSADVKSPMKK